MPVSAHLIHYKELFLGELSEVTMVCVTTEIRTMNVQWFKRYVMFTEVIIV